MAIEMTGSGNLHELEDGRGDWTSHSVSPVAVTRSGRRGDVAAGDLFDVLALVGVHLQQAADALRACPWRRW